jgi:hypothetical protein
MPAEELEEYGVKCSVLNMYPTTQLKISALSATAWTPLPPTRSSQSGTPVLSGHVTCKRY